MVNLALPSELCSLVGTACQIVSAREHDMQKSREIIFLKSVFLYSTKIVLKKRVSQLLSLKYFL